MSRQFESRTGLLPEESSMGARTDPSFDMPDVEEHCCPSCDEELAGLYHCTKHCKCQCHKEERNGY